MAEFNAILYSVADRVARITLNRPEKRNALSFEMRREIVDALRMAERDDSVSVVLIDGAGTSFCSGYDITPGARESEQPPYGWVSSPYYQPWTDQFARSCLRDWLTIWDLLKPVVAKVHGNCLAGGTEIMSMADIAFVADDARIGYPPMRGQTTPDTLYFPWKMSMAQAKYLQLTGNSVTGREAAEMGWVAKSFPEADLEAETMRELRAIATIAPDLLAANKQSVNQAYEIMGFRTALQTAWQWHALSGHLRPGAGDFSRIAREKGLKSALQWRDEGFTREGFQ
ncbi:MAG: enoyl-CoA hydratase/isomerase family protein [Dehalococcoidia bacterium]|nr:enoyl-CoA hydratase/isomerase family protein [Dehalococcoidia bacterium]